MICRYAVCVLIISITLLINLGIVSASEQDEKKDLIKGTAIVAVRTGSVAGLGHVGVAFQNADGTWTAGAIEGAPEKSLSNLGGLLVLPSGDEGAWSKKFNTREEVENEFLRLDYDKLKEIYVDNSNPDRANKEIEKFESAGYLAPFNDCLTRTDDVLRAYGVNTNMNQFGVVTSVTGPIGAAARLTSDVVPNVYFYSIPGKEISLKSNDAQVDHSFGDQNDLGGINFTSIKLNYISLSADSSGGVNFDLILKSQKADEMNTGTEPIKSTLIGTTAFLTGLSIPNDRFWVNLAPWEPDRIIDDELKGSEVGRIMLEADLQMKKDFSNYGNPCSSQIGKNFWMFLDGKREILVQQCMRKFPGEIEDKDNIYFRPVTRHWIIPDKVYAYTNGNEIYIINATLTISSEPVTDHATFAVNNQDVKTLSRGCLEELNGSAREFSHYAKELQDSMILPYVIADINHADKYEDLRNVYVALALAQWYKSRISPEMDIFREGLSSSESDVLNVLGPWDHRKIWEDYVYSFENGEYRCWENTTTKTTDGILFECQFRSEGGVEFYDINDKLVEIVGMPPEVQDKVERAVAEGFIDDGDEVLFGSRVYVNRMPEAAAIGSGSGSGTGPTFTEDRRHSRADGGDNETSQDEEDIRFSIGTNLAISSFNQGNALYNLHKYDDAVKAYDEAIKLDPNLAIAWSNKGNALNNLGKHEDAIEAYNEAIRIDPSLEIAKSNLAIAWSNKGNILSGQEKFDDAIEAYTEAIRIDPSIQTAKSNLAIAWSNKGNIFSNHGKYDDAIEAYTEAIRIDPSLETARINLAATWNNKGNELYNQGKYVDAVEAYDKAIALNPESASTWYNKGNALKILGKMSEADAAYARARELE